MIRSAQAEENPIPYLLLAVLFVIASPASSYVTLDWVVVGAGNPCDTQSQGCFGAVAEPYRISRFEITNAQYAEFLNAVAAADPNRLYDPINMSQAHGGITRDGSSGSFSYSLIAGREAMPVNYVNFWSATRFANWLSNGQPTGAQDNATTEEGAYTLTPTGIANNTVTRNSGARVFLPSEDEWYKAAYYEAGTMIYFGYPAGTDAQTTCMEPGATPNTANCGFIVVDVTAVGSYTGAASPAGTFDQGGNVWEWNETIIVGGSGSVRGIRGGGFIGPSMGASERPDNGLPVNSASSVGFRVASLVPRPVPTLSALGVVMLASLLAVEGLRRSRFN